MSQPNGSSVRQCRLAYFAPLLLAAFFALYWTRLNAGSALSRRPLPVAWCRLMISDRAAASASLSGSSWNVSTASNVSACTVTGIGCTTSVSPPIVYIRFIDPLAGLGNKMFQYASSLSLALRHGCDVRLVVDHDGIRSALATMKQAFVLTPLPVVTVAPPPSVAASLVESGWGRYDAGKFDSLTTFVSSVSVLGYLQSWKYFQPVASRIRHEFALTQSMAAIVDCFFQTMGLVHEDLVVGVHVRRGDMVSHPELYTVAPPDFIKMAVNHYVTKYGRSHRLLFLFATNDRTWVDDVVARHLPRNLTVRHLSFSPEVDMAILSRCNHSIVTAGTFGWWSAWLAGGDVVYYKDFIGGSSRLLSGFNPTDYYPPHWLGLA